MNFPDRLKRCTGAISADVCTADIFGPIIGSIRPEILVFLNCSWNEGCLFLPAQSRTCSLLSPAIISSISIRILAWSARSFLSSFSLADNCGATSLCKYSPWTSSLHFLVVLPAQRKLCSSSPTQPRSRFSLQPGAGCLSAAPLETQS